MRRILLVLLLGVLLSSCREIVEKEADDKIALAEAALREEQWEAADSAFYEAILLDPDRAEAWIGRGMTLTHLSKTEYARTHYEEALELYQARLEADPHHPGALRRSIMLLVLLNQSEEATALAEQTARDHPDQEFAQALPALVQEMESQFSEMILPPPTESETASMFENGPLRVK
jgi:Flp pilus assembly protein TadD